MKNENRWAFIGKLLSSLLALITLILGALQLVDRFSDPNVYAVIELQNEYINPKIRKIFEGKISKAYLLDSIKARRAKNESPIKIIEAVEENLSNQKNVKLLDEIDLLLMRSKIVVLCTIKNDSKKLIREVQIMLPGEGQAELFSELRPLGSGGKIKSWVHKLNVGDIRPNSSIDVMVWFDEMPFHSINSIKPAVIYAGGTVKVMETHKFYGFPADVAAWFISQSLFIRIVLICSLIGITTMIFWAAFHLKLISGWLRKKNHEETS